jgi:hypothetical protein
LLHVVIMTKSSGTSSQLYYRKEER